MAEQKEAGGGGFAAEVGSLFELWNAPDGREWVGAEEMARQFQQAEDLFDGLSTPPSALSATAPTSSWATRKGSRQGCERYVRKPSPAKGTGGRTC